jgi:hypothetical protein
LIVINFAVVAISGEIVAGCVGGLELLVGAKALGGSKNAERERPLNNNNYMM